MIEPGELRGEGEPQPRGGEFDDAEKLMSYIRGQFFDAATKKSGEAVRGEDALHGSFLRVVPLPGPHEWTRDSSRIVLKRPHPNEEVDKYYEIYAICLGPKEETDLIEMISDAKQYIINDATQGNGISKLWLIDEDGAHMLTPTNSFDPETGFSVQQDTSNPFEPYQDAANILEDIMRYNIVASED